MAVMAVIKNDVVVNIIVAEPGLTIPGYEVITVENSGIAGEGYRRDETGNWNPPEVVDNPEYTNIQDV
ncbi:hypothetical protein KI694_12385 [Enterobacter oligotrophicus]|uniref:hypothetical protein n=1 Tax=Enterobacter oligotrophicus TaxID=2478464 RepID=UPI001C0241C0|nr:hypothetical protein [Enterobacter oligotrophicus]ELW1646508.1 hypothetical protein [Enterobacter oligotrophicus]MBT9426322.1 hypothetical protein [Enterobacter oligotrophicus]